MSEEVNNEITTLDYLNEDCWRAVLQYVPVRDLIRTERASRRWQQLVLMYLRGVHIVIEDDENDSEEDDENKSKVQSKSKEQSTCTLNFTDDIESFEYWAKKLGTSVAATYCNSLESLAVIKKYCPNIKSLQLFSLKIETPEQLLEHNLHSNFELLQRVYFLDCTMSDLYVCLFIADKPLKELEFHYCDKLTGLCFNTLNWSNLQRFVLDWAKPFKAFILPAVERLGELKELELVDIDTEILEQIQLLLDKMPKLERLIMYNCNKMSCHSSVPLSRLSRLKHLELSFQMNTWDVAEVIRCCQDLQTLQLWDCLSLTPEFVASVFRRAGARLTTLSLGRLLVDDDEVVALVRSCPQLTSLTVRDAYRLTRALPARAAAARRLARPGRPLRLDLSQTNLASHTHEMLEAEVNQERTTLDYLNEDCWRAVLQYVPVRDLIRTERASRRWQEVVLTYLRGIRIIIAYEFKITKSNLLTIRLPEKSFKSFESWTEKLGPSVVATYCGLGSLAVIKENCPNLQDLKLRKVACTPEQLIPYNLHENFKFLRRVHFTECPISDACVSQFIADKALEELQISVCGKVTGFCFNSMNLSKLKSLHIEACGELKSQYFLPAFDRLSELTALRLMENDEIQDEIQLVLHKIPKLECLELYHDTRRTLIFHSPKTLSRLTRLKHLIVSIQLTDTDLANVTRCCQKLVTLDLLDCGAMTSSFVQPLCRHAGARLTVLKLSSIYAARDDHVLALIRGCPRLETLEVCNVQRLTCALPARAAAARHAASAGRRLRLHVGFTNLHDEFYKQRHDRRHFQTSEIMKRKYEDLIVIYDDDLMDDDDDIMDDDDFTDDDDEETGLEADGK